MKKISMTFLVAGLVMVGSLQAQSVQDGVNDLYAKRFKSAKATFEKLLASNPNNIDATYWLGQTFLEMDDVTGAKAVYDKALLASANAPLVIVGRGQVDLVENKISEARQRFEAAITMTRGKKGDDPVILNAVGRAITDVYDDKEKKGDINYAIQQLEAAGQRDSKNAEIFLNLGNAYRKSKPGEAGGLAFQNYQKAIAANPNFPVPYYRLAQLFYSQKNWELYEKYLNDAVDKDPKFAPAYYDLSYYKMGKLDFAAAEAFAKKYSDSADPDPSNEYLRASILYFQKNYDQSIELAKSIISRSGDKPNPKLYKLIAYNYVDKKDTAAAKPFVDDFFAKEKPEEITAVDYKLKADIYSAIPGQEATVLASYVEGIKADTVLENKMDVLKKGIAFFGARKQFDKEAALQDLLLTVKPSLTINDYFGAGIANYRDSNYAKSYEIFKTVAEKYPDQIFGWEWKFRNAMVIDTVKVDSIAVPDALKLLDFVKGDTTKYASQITAASYLLATYYNGKSDKEKAIEYLKMMKSATTDPGRRESIQSNIDALSRPQKQPATRPAPKTGNGK